MTSCRKNKEFISFDPDIGYPKGKNVFYECVICGDIIPSIPEDSIQCSCHNVHVDVDYGRVVVKDFNSFKVFKCDC